MRAICYTKCNTYTGHLFKMCYVLKFNDLYDTELLIFYKKLLNNNTSSNYLNLKPTLSKANERYIILCPKYTLPSHNHECIKLTCTYQLHSLLKQYNATGNDAENNMDHILSPYPIKTVCNTIFLLYLSMLRQ